MNRVTRRPRRLTAAWAAPLALLALCLLSPAAARAQWATSPYNPNNISNTNTGGVGVGTNNPGNYRVHVFGVGSSVDALIANFFGSHNVQFESQAGYKVGVLNNYLNWNGNYEAERGVVTLGYSNGPSASLTGFYSHQQVWNNNATAMAVYGNSDADASGSLGQQLFGGYFTARTTDTSGGAGNVAYGLYAIGTVGASTNPYHSAFGVLARARAAAGTDPTVATYAVYADATNSGSGAAYGVYSAAGANYFNGRVGVGTGSPSYSLDVQGGQVNASGGLCIAGDCRVSWSQVAGGGNTSSQWTTASGTQNIFYNAGSIGIGTSSPATVLHVLTAGATKPQFVLQNTTATTQIETSLAGNAVQWNYGMDQADGGKFKFSTDGGGNLAAGVKLTLDAAGNLNAAGAITGATVNATYQDVAEWVPSSQKLQAGTVVVLDTDHTNQVLASSKSYDTKVAGVVSARPGISLGEGGEGKALVATTGRVRVKVDATRAPIKVGDLLVTSDVEGVAMKSIPVDLGGTQIHRPGTIIGKALEPIEKGTGEILVLLSLQ